MLLLALPFDVSRQVSIALRFPLPLAFAASLQATAQAFAVAFQVVPIEVEVAALAGQCDVRVSNSVVVAKGVDAADGRAVPRELANIALPIWLIFGVSD